MTYDGGTDNGLSKGFKELLSITLLVVIIIYTFFTFRETYIVQLN